MSDKDDIATPDKSRRRATTKKTARKSNKKAAKKTTKKSASKQLMDRSQIQDKTRVFALAKMLGMQSKELIIALSDLGLVKVAQSTLTRAETEQLLDALEQAPATPTAAQDSADTKSAADDADEKIRHRVRKDVENEINQITEKVEADLEQVLAEDAEGAPQDTEDTPIDVEDLVEEISAEEAAEAEAHATEVEEATEVYAPIFKAPTGSRRRVRRSGSAAKGDADKQEEKREEKQESAADQIQEPKAIKGSSRLEAQRRRRTERREEERKRSRVVSQAEFLARRESVERTMVVRERARHDGPGKLTQVGVLEDGLLVEHFVDSDESASMIGNIYLGRVQNVLPSMEAAFIDIGQGRNGVLYAGEVDWKSAGLGGRSRRIEQALKSGDQVLVQVTKDPVGHKGARLTTQISLAGRFLVYVPGGRSAGISRKLPAPERKRLKDILVKVVPGKGGAIIRTAAEGASEEAIGADVARLHTQWEAIQEQAEKEKNSPGSKPVTLYEEPKLLVKVVRDLFNEDFDALVVDGKKSWNVVHNYVQSVAPDLLDRVEKFDRSEHDGKDAFEVYRIDEQIQKALSRIVWLPSGGTLVIDRTEAMTVIDVNTGKFTGSGGSLEETVTANNMEAAEEIVRQLRLRDIGGMIIIDFIDMILPENQELVLRRLKEALGRDRTRHQVSEVTSLGLVQLTRKRLGTGLVETFSTKCEHCDGRGIVLSDDPVTTTDTSHHADSSGAENSHSRSSRRHKPAQNPGNHPTALAMNSHEDSQEDSNGSSSIEALADAVVSAEDAEEQPKRRSSRRRGRRGSGRGRGRSESQQQEQKRDTTAEETTQTTSQTYEEALEEFENSPRRKRNTRGNSKSDHRPRREDFEKGTPAKAEHTSEAQSEVSIEVKEKAPVTRTTGGRGRRRATRKTSTSVHKVPEPKQRQEAKEATSRTPTRGRRRATRRRTT